MTVGLTRASAFAIKKETVQGEYAKPTLATDFLPLRPGNEASYEPEKLESDELLNDIGASKSAIGKENVSGTHPAYLRHSGIEGQEPQLGLLWESLLGAKDITVTELTLIAGSTAKILNLGIGQGANVVQGKAILVKAGTGYEMRNVDSVVGDTLVLNFALSQAPVSGVKLGKAITYLPVAQGHPTFSTTKYLGNGFAIEAIAGSTTKEAKITLKANTFGEVEFSYDGVSYFYDPIIITATNKFLDFTDDSGDLTIELAERVYKTPMDLADGLLAAFQGTSLETFQVDYDNSTGKFKISSGSTVLELNFLTGPNTANTIAPAIGFPVADQVGAVTYTSPTALTFATPVTPAFDSADQIIVKDNELFIGNADSNICVCAQEVTLTISKETEDVDCICEPTGISEKIPTTRKAELTTTVSVKKYDVALLNALLKNGDVSAMFNGGPKNGGNWVPGKCVNFYMQKATVSSFKTSGDSFIQANITLSGFVTSDKKDIYVNFV